MTKKPTKVGPVGERGGADMSRTETAIARESEIGGDAEEPTTRGDSDETRATPKLSQPATRPKKNRA